MNIIPKNQITTGVDSDPIARCIHEPVFIDPSITASLQVESLK
jgi:hypothetical protein